MAGRNLLTDAKKAMIHKAKVEPNDQVHAQMPGGQKSALTDLQRQVGNEAVQRLLAQRSGDGAFNLDDETAGRISRERGGGQALDAGLQKSIEASLGADFSGVRVHTSAESDALNRDLGASAFTTGQDLFFRQGAYQPEDSGGQELIAHELTHVVQQSTGAVGSSGGRMQVNAPGDAFEQQANAVARSLTGPSGIAAGVSQQAVPEEEVQMQELPEEEEEVQMQEEETLQRQEL